MEEVSRLENEIILGREKTENLNASNWKAYLPAILAIAGALQISRAGCN